MNNKLTEALNSLKGTRDYIIQSANDRLGTRITSLYQTPDVIQDAASKIDSLMDANNLYFYEDGILELNKNHSYPVEIDYFTNPVEVVKIDNAIVWVSDNISASTLKNIYNITADIPDNIILAFRDKELQQYIPDVVNTYLNISSNRQYIDNCPEILYNLLGIGKQLTMVNDPSVRAAIDLELRATNNTDYHLTGYIEQDGTSGNRGIFGAASTDGQLYITGTAAQTTHAKGTPDVGTKRLDGVYGMMGTTICEGTRVSRLNKYTDIDASANDWLCSNTLWLYGRNYKSSPDKFNGVFKFISLKIFENNVLQNQFVPANDSDGNAILLNFVYHGSMDIYPVALTENQFTVKLEDITEPLMADNTLSLFKEHVDIPGEEE